MNADHRQFYNTVMEYYGEYGRHDLPWRANQTPYRVAVSEIMLQQTQAPRVIEHFNRWMKQFPSWKKLAEASTQEVLQAWQGLGYNSRALRLHQLAQIVSGELKGRLPHEYDELRKLPGIGPYTAGAIRAFAWNLWTPLIETNIRRVFLHHFFEGKENISDREILICIEEVGEPDDPRTWCEALMDYGATLPKIVQHNPNERSKHYTKQPAFKGSNRELRGRALRILLASGGKGVMKRSFCYELERDTTACNRLIEAFKKEGLITITKNRITLR